ncbi:hypothetical protein JOM56_009098, partial [Amanita muscaria]
GHRGRGRLEIDRDWLAYTSQVQLLRAIADELGCHPRTVRRRQLEYGLAKHAPPVIQYVQHQDGTQTKEWHPTGPSMSDLNRDPQALDGVVGEILEGYPDYGIEYLHGAVRSKGHRISREHIRDSYHRVMGIRSRFLHRPVERRVYSVPSVNSLWHHDGYHTGSVHNIRIERLWVEVGRAIVSKWKPFFESLERHHGLDVDSAGHIWLLHHLYLRALNEEILGWAEHWNSHTMRLKHEANKSPRQMF